jgi:tRNA1Val (adenine37-N6)-methyltransferase
MANTYFQFRQFTVHQDNCAMKVSTDSCLFGAWVAEQSAGAAGNLLDIGAGTGLLSLMLAQSTNTSIEAVEVEDLCFRQLTENIDTSDWKHRIKCVHVDILKYSPEKNYDLIISNPPFYENQLQSPDAAVNLARHANELSIAALFQKVKDLIHPEGEFYVLIPFYRLAECLERADKLGFFVHQQVEVRHSNQHKPFRAMIGFRITPVEKKFETIEVNGHYGQYSPRFKNLLSPFYLKV